MPSKRKYRTALSVVPIKREDEFNRRCQSALLKNKIQAATQPLSILGSAVLEKKTSVPTYMAKIRNFVKFLLDFPVFDDSLLLFYPYTPKGSVTCEDKAVSYFLLSMHGKQGAPLLDLDVRFMICIVHSSPVHFTLLIFFLHSL